MTLSVTEMNRTGRKLTSLEFIDSWLVEYLPYSPEMKLSFVKSLSSSSEDFNLRCTFLACVSAHHGCSCAKSRKRCTS